MSRTIRNPGKETRRDGARRKRCGERRPGDERRGWKYALMRPRPV